MTATTLSEPLAREGDLETSQPVTSVELRQTNLEEQVSRLANVNDF